MPRKKVSANENDLTGVAELDDDEQLVVSNTTTKTIRRERRPPEVPAAEGTITVEPDDFDDDEIIAGEIDRPAYAATSLAALLYGDDGERIENQYCTVNVRRNPDSMNDRFATPCGSNTHLPRLANIDLTADRADIEDRVRAEYGGGHYFFQIYFNGRLGPSWQATLADLPEHMRRANQSTAATATAAPEPASVPAAPVNPFDQMFDALAKQKQLKDLLFGDTERELKSEIERLKADAAARPNVPAEPPNERLLILEKALGVNNPTIQQRLLDSAFPADEAGHWIPETIKAIFEHKEELAGLAGMLLGGLLPKPPTAPGGSLTALMQQPPPGSTPMPMISPPASRLTRKRSDDEPAAIDDRPAVETQSRADNGTDAEIDAIDADETPEPVEFVPRIPVMKPGIGGAVAVIDDETVEMPELTPPTAAAPAPLPIPTGIKKQRGKSK